MKRRLMFLVMVIAMQSLIAQEVKISHNDPGYFENTTDYELNANLPDGIYTVYLDNSKTVKHYSGEIRNKKRINTWTWFFETGLKKTEIKYVDNLVVEKTSYYPTGEKSVTWSYNMGVLNGPIFRWHKNGIVSMTGSYLNGLPSGLWKYYKDDGTLAKEQQK
jgi:antitoxin component YwqK of YwqJK toxin-antitoxin module